MAMLDTKIVLRHMIMADTLPAAPLTSAHSGSQKVAKTPGGLREDR